MNYLSTFAAWAGLLGAIVAVAPRLIAALTRRSEVQSQGEISRFESLTSALERQLAECRSAIAREHDKWETEIKHERAERVRERDFLLRQLTETRAQVTELLGVLRRQGWRDERKQPRTREDPGT